MTGLVRGNNSTPSGGWKARHAELNAERDAAADSNGALGPDGVYVTMADDGDDNRAITAADVLARLDAAYTVLREHTRIKHTVPPGALKSGEPLCAAIPFTVLGDVMLGIASAQDFLGADQ